MHKTLKYLSPVHITIILTMFFCDLDKSKNDPDVSPDTNDVIDNTDTLNKVERPMGWEFDSHDKDASPNYNLIFNQNTVERLDITLTAESWQAILNDLTTIIGPFGQENRPNNDILNIFNLFLQPPNDGQVRDPDIIEETPVYVPCTISYQGKQWWFVGIRCKGNSSLSNAWRSSSYKFPFRLNFDKFEDEHPEIKNQRFYGFDNISLSNNITDKSFMRQKIAMDSFNEGGVPAPMTCYMQVYIDKGVGPEYFGLYTITEIIDYPFLNRTYGSSAGNLYKPTGTGATFSIFNQASFDKENNEDAADWSDVISAINALNADRSQPDVWRNNLEEHLYVDGFLHWLAMNTVIKNWDAYGQMAQNYYLYGDPAKNGQLQWLPWDADAAFTPNGGPGGDGTRNPITSVMQANITATWPLIRYTIDDAVYKQRYINYVKESITYPLTIAWLTARINNYRTLIQPYVAQEKAPYSALKSTAEFNSAVNSLLNYVNTRINQVTTEMKQFN
jgi:spore coat protein H